MKKIFNFILLIFLLIFIIIYSMPFIVTLSNSFFTQNEITFNYSKEINLFYKSENIKNFFIKMNLIPAKFSLGQYKNIFFLNPSYMILLKNSIFITLSILVFNTILSIITAYGYTIVDFRNKKFF